MQMKTAISPVVKAATDAATKGSESPVKCLRLYVGKEHIRRFDFNENGHLISVYHLYPTLADWVGKEAPDRVNPRSHDEDCLNTNVAKAIEETVRDWPQDFYLANRGGTVLVKSLQFDANSGMVELVVEDEELHGMADGATTDAVVAKVQREIAAGKRFLALRKEEIPPFMKEARLHIEVIVGLDNRDRIGRLVLGRNTSRQVKSWSMADFKGLFDWIHDILERPRGPFVERVGYEENAGKEVTILDVLSYLTVFHQQWDAKGGEKRKAPTVAYSSKGRLDTQLQNEDLQPGYKALSPILEDILRLHDHVYANFEKAYNEATGPGAKLGRRQGVESRKGKTPVTLPLTGTQSNYVIPSGVIFPLLASLRCLVAYDAKGNAHWKCDPFKFFDRHGADIMGGLWEQVDLLGGNPQTAGKKKAVYTTLHDRARLLLQDDTVNSALK